MSYKHFCVLLLIIFWPNGTLSLNDTVDSIVLRPFGAGVQEGFITFSTDAQIQSPCSPLKDFPEFLSPCEAHFERIQNILGNIQWKKTSVSSIRRKKRDFGITLTIILFVVIIGYLVYQRTENENPKKDMGNITGNQAEVIRKVTAKVFDALEKIDISDKQKKYLSTLADLERRLHATKHDFNQGKLTNEFREIFQIPRNITTDLRFWVPYELAYNKQTGKLRAVVGVPILSKKLSVLKVDPFVRYEISPDGAELCKYRYTFDAFFIVDNSVPKKKCYRRFSQSPITLKEDSVILPTEYSSDTCMEKVDPRTWFTKEACSPNSAASRKTAVQAKLVDQSIHLYCNLNSAKIGSEERQCIDSVYQIPLSVPVGINGVKLTAQNISFTSRDPLIVHAIPHVDIVDDALRNEIREINELLDETDEMIEEFKKTSKGADIISDMADIFHRAVDFVIEAWNSWWKRVFFWLGLVVFLILFVLIMCCCCKN